MSIDSRPRHLWLNWLNHQPQTAPLGTPDRGRPASDILLNVYTYIYIDICIDRYRLQVYVQIDIDYRYRYATIHIIQSYYKLSFIKHPCLFLQVHPQLVAPRGKGSSTFQPVAVNEAGKSKRSSMGFSCYQRIKKMPSFYPTW